ncbi:hypothetical protein EIP91_007618 [Steccherinum ochraceum]|uniref:Uncharacterized protein n=1 Tax=Steccherinum ochraceum TaxID=92696 RepID=A0A4R0R6R4_9APHY|nr:hypothetical protein EIP91_007618 [Steccherinum ochraceum]
MRFTTLLAALLALTATSTFAAPLPLAAKNLEAVEPREDPYDPYNVFHRDIAQDLEARELWARIRLLPPVPIRPLPRPPNRPPAPVGPRPRPDAPQADPAPPTPPPSPVTD